MQAAVHDCLADAIRQYCRIVGQDSSDRSSSDSDSVTDGSTSSSESDVHADAQEHSTGTAMCIVELKSCQTASDSATMVFGMSDN